MDRGPLLRPLPVAGRGAGTAAGWRRARAAVGTVAMAAALGAGLAAAPAGSSFPSPAAIFCTKCGFTVPLACVKFQLLELSFVLYGVSIVIV